MNNIIYEGGATYYLIIINFKKLFLTKYPHLTKLKKILSLSLHQITVLINTQLTLWIITSRDITRTIDADR